MSYIAVIALKAKDPRDKDKKSRGTMIRAGKIVPFELDDVQVEKWLAKGFIREAEFGELAEAVASGELPADVLGSISGEKKTTRKGKVPNKAAGEPEKEPEKEPETKKDDDDLT